MTGIEVDLMSKKTTAVKITSELNERTVSIITYRIQTHKQDIYDRVAIIKPLVTTVCDKVIYMCAGTNELVNSKWSNGQTNHILHFSSLGDGCIFGRHRIGGQV